MTGGRGMAGRSVVGACQEWGMITGKGGAQYTTQRAGKKELVGFKAVYKKTLFLSA